MLAWIHTVLGGSLLVVGFLLVVGIAFDRSEWRALPFVGGLFFWMGVVLFGPSLIGGIGLLRYKRWARVLLVIVSVELLFAFPLGTALGGYGLWTLLQQRTEPLLVHSPPPGVERQHTDLLKIMLAVLSAFLVVLGGGFWLFRHTPALGASRAWGVLMGVALVAAAFLFARLLAVPKRASSVRSGLVVPAANTVGWPTARVQPLTESAQLAYVNDPSLTLTCPHLQPYERAIRSAGIAVIPTASTIVKTRCRVNRAALLRQFGLADPVSYREYFEAERSAEDFPIAHLQCGQCGSRVDTLHPAECALSTPWFPAPPPPLILNGEHLLVPKVDVTAITGSPSGRFAAVAAGLYNQPQVIAVWDITRREAVRSYPSHGVVRSITWSRDERTLITGRGVAWHSGQGSLGPSIFVRDVESGREVLQFGSDLFGVRGIALSSDGRLLLAAGMLGKTRLAGSTLDVWEVASGRLFARLARIDAPSMQTLPFFTAVAFTPYNTLALAACDRYTLPRNQSQRGKPDANPHWNLGIRAWRLSDGQEVEFLRQQAPVQALSVASDGSRLFFAGQRMGVWDLKTRSMLWDMAHTDQIGVAASADCRVVARGTGYQVDNHAPYENTAVEIYSGDSGELLSRGEHRRPPEAIGFTANGSSLVAGGAEGELRFWSLTAHLLP